MKTLVRLIIPVWLFASCHKANTPGCNMEQVYAANVQKVTITNGIWGTVANTQGNCMPSVPPAATTCQTCPVQRTIKIYAYSLLSNATPYNGSPVFFDSFNTTLVAEANTDENVFFQVSLPPGHYSLAVVENGKLYANGSDGQGGINPFTFTGGTQNINVVMTYQAVF